MNATALLHKDFASESHTPETLRLTNKRLIDAPFIRMSKGENRFHLYDVFPETHRGLLQ